MRPLGLGSDSGFSGGVGVIALPCCLALLATWRSRRRWVAALLCARCARRRGDRPRTIAGDRRGARGARVRRARVARRAQGFARARRDARRDRPGDPARRAVRRGRRRRARSSATKASRRAKRPRRSPATSPRPGRTSPTSSPRAPLGVGLGTVGAAGGFGGKISELVEGHGVSAETQYNVVADELGVPGLIVWIALTLYVIVLAGDGHARLSPTASWRSCSPARLRRSSRSRSRASRARSSRARRGPVLLAGDRHRRVLVRRARAQHAAACAGPPSARTSSSALSRWPHEPARSERT